MLLIVALFGVYFGLWQLTATYGVDDVIQAVYGEHIAEPSEWGVDSWAPTPMIIQLTEPHPVGISSIVIVRRYYLWYWFGVIRLPFQADDPPPPEVG